MASPGRRVTAGRRWWAQSIGGRGLRRIREIDLDTHALALCAQQVLCTAPLIVAMSAVLQRTSHRNVSYVISRFFGLHDDSAAAVQRLFGRSSASISTLALVIGLITSVIFTTSVAAVQQRGFEMIWTLPRFSGVRSYLRQLVWTPALAVFSALVLLAGRFGREIDPSGHGPGTWAIIGLQGFLTFLFYWWTQHWLLRGRVEWKALFLGSFTVGVLTTLLVRLSRVIMPGQISWQVHAYGLVGAVFVLSIWLMISSVLVFGGVLFGALVAEKKAGRPRYRRDELGDSPLTRKGHNSAAAAQDRKDGRLTEELEDVAARPDATASAEQARQDHETSIAQMAAFRR